MVLKSQILLVESLLKNFDFLNFDRDFFNKTNEVSLQIANKWSCFTRFMDHTPTHESNLKKNNPYQALQDIELNQASRITTKAEIRRVLGSQNYQKIIASKGIKELWSKETSGSTGNKVNILFEKIFHMEELLLGVPKILFVSKINPIEQPIRSIHITDSHSNGSHLYINPIFDNHTYIRHFWNPLQDSDGYTLRKLLEAFQPNVISARPEILLHILSLEGIERFLTENSLLIAICSGNKLTLENQNILAKKLKIPIINAYATTETGLVASTCLENNGLHIYQNECAIEVLEKELLVTTLRNKALPLFRFQVGDQGYILTDSCPCGCPTSRLFLKNTRTVPFFILPDGEKLNPSPLNNLTKLFQIQEFQAIQEKSNNVQIYIELEEKANSQQVQREVFNYCNLIFNKKLLFTIEFKKFDPFSKHVRYKCLSS